MKVTRRPDHYLRLRLPRGVTSTLKLNKRRAEPRAASFSPAVPPPCPQAAVANGQQRLAIVAPDLRQRPSMAGRMVLPKLAVVVQVQGRDSASVLPPILYRAARPGTIPHSRPLWTPAGQGERRPGEASRTLLDELHPAENRKVGGSIPSLPTTTVQVSACGTGPPVGRQSTGLPAWRAARGGAALGGWLLSQAMRGWKHLHQG